MILQPHPQAQPQAQPQPQDPLLLLPAEPVRLDTIRGEPSLVWEGQFGRQLAFEKDPLEDLYGQRERLSERLSEADDQQFEFQQFQFRLWLWGL